MVKTVSLLFVYIQIFFREYFLTKCRRNRSIPGARYCDICGDSIFGRLLVLEKRMPDEPVPDERLRFHSTDKLKKACVGTQTATIRLPTNVAKNINDVGKVKVGWTVCLLITPHQIVRCYKCMGFRHRAKLCKDTYRSKSCWRCGDNVITSKTCVRTPKYMLCNESKGTNHFTCSLRCKAYKNAVSKGK